MSEPGLWESTKKKAVEHVASVIVVGGAGLVALVATTTWASLKKWTALEFPSGAVVAFHFRSSSIPANCPPGWGAISDVRGRVIIGAGPHENRDEQGKKLKEYAQGQNGGIELTKLTERELPPHSHSFQGKAVTRGGNAGTGREVAIGDGFSFGEFTPTGTIGNTGQGQEFTNMPPFIAMFYCLKD